MEEDLKNPQERNEELFHADEANNFYEKGDFAASRLPSIETYLLKKVITLGTSVSLSCCLVNKALILYSLFR